LRPSRRMPCLINPPDDGNPLCETNMIVGCRMHKPQAANGGVGLQRKYNRSYLKNTRHEVALERSQSLSPIAPSYFERPFVISNRPYHHYLLLNVIRDQIHPPAYVGNQCTRKKKTTIHSYIPRLCTRGKENHRYPTVGSWDTLCLPKGLKIYALLRCLNQNIFYYQNFPRG